MLSEIIHLTRFQVDFILIMLWLIPITAFTDYFIFRKRLKEQFGNDIKWYYFFPSCVLEIVMFIAGFIIRGVLNGFN